MARAARRRPAPRRRKSVSISEELIAARGQLYEEQRDAFRAWEAYLLTRRNPWGQKHRVPLPLPDWVAEYLERVALELTVISHGQLMGRALQAALVSALEVGGRGRRGRGALFARRAKLRRHQQYAIDVQHLIRAGRKPYLASEEVARFHKVNRSTVDRAYAELKARGFYLVAGGSEGPPSPSGTLPD